MESVSGIFKYNFHHFPCIGSAKQFAWLGLPVPVHLCLLLLAMQSFSCTDRSSRGSFKIKKSSLYLYMET